MHSPPERWRMKTSGSCDAPGRDSSSFGSADPWRRGSGPRPACGRLGCGTGENSKAEGAEGYDAIVTNQPGVILAVQTADCVPVLIFDPKQRVIAAVHAGWRGTLREVVPKTVRCMMDRFSCRPSAIVAGIGPSIRSCCYEVGEMVLAPLAARCSYWHEVTKGSGREGAC